MGHIDFNMLRITMGILVSKVTAYLEAMLMLESDP